MTVWDTIIVGAGNAAFCAAHAAREQGASVLMLECAPEEENGGNSRYTAGAIRFAYDGVDDIRALCPDLSEEQIAITDFGTYTTDQFFDDMFRVTRFRTDPALCERLVTTSRETMHWMRSKGIRFMPIYGRQAFKVDGRFKFWGGLTLESWGGGPGLVDAHTNIARTSGVEIRYDTRALELLTDGHAVIGVRVRHKGRIEDLSAKSVVVATGGFQASPEMRTRYLGPGWEMARVRGSRFNTGEGIRMAMQVGASTYGNWSGCHAVGWDYNAPEFGDLAVGDGFQKHSYPWGIMVNANGRRFVDEGADFRNYTYAKYGRVILNQPDQFAWQIFDAKVSHFLRDEYRIKEVTKVTAPTLEQLAQKLEGVDPQGFLDEIGFYNAAVDTDTPFDPRAIALQSSGASAAARRMSSSRYFGFCAAQRNRRRIDSLSSMRRMMFRAIRRTTARFSAPWPARFRRSSSPIWTSRTQCRLFSIAQWFRTAFRSSSGDIFWLMMQ